MVPPDGVNHDTFGLVCLILLEEKVCERRGRRVDLHGATGLTLANGNEGSWPTGWLHRQDHGAVTERGSWHSPQAPSEAPPGR